MRRWFAVVLMALAAPALAETPAARADHTLAAMTPDEKLRLVFGYFGSAAPWKGTLAPEGARAGSAGYVPGVPRLRVPPLWETDAGLGVASQSHGDAVRAATALPSGLATAATWNPQLADAGGEMIGREARAYGFNVMLAGGVNLVRDPRNGRNFEYAGEDPLLAGTIVGAEIRGIQSNHIISTVKHFALNGQETGRRVLSADIGEKAARESDLLAFEIAITQGDPGAVMCAYNKVNAVPACGSDFLLNQVLKRDFAYPYFVMSDWGAVHAVADANAGLDQESAADAFDDTPYFGAPLRAALARGAVQAARLDDMARRILLAIYAKGVADDPVSVGAADLAADGAISEKDEEQAIVLLKNAEGILPLPRSVKRVAIIGSHADVGVLSGGGSSQVYPPGGAAVPGLGPKDFPGPEIYFPSSPLKAIAARLPGAAVRFASGEDAAAAAKLAAESDVVLVFAHQWAAESQDVSLTLPDGQDALIARVAAANPHVVVVLETGGAVLMPWLDRVQGVLEAWYPGTSGAEAIARVLFGEVDTGGRLPITFPRDAAQLPRPVLDGDPAHPERPFAVSYAEGAAVGYKWFAARHLEPLFPFGFGLSYGRVAYDGFTVHGDAGGVRVDFDARNVTPRAIFAVPQIYASAAGWDVPERLVGWRKILLAPGAAAHITVAVDPRVLAVWNMNAHGWRIPAGSYDFTLGSTLRASCFLSASSVPIP